jgi:hypothetical protein
MSVPDWLKTNAYRVLRITAGASLSDVYKAATSMRRSVRLGAVSAAEADIAVLGEIPRTEADIRVATGRLENPTQRIFDRLFWLHSIDSAVSVRPGGLDTALWNHDQALRAIFAAFETGFDEAGIWAWTRALRAWHQVVSDEGYWTRSLEFENDGAFEPAAFPSEIDELRYKAVELAAEPLVMAGREALVRNDAAVVRLVLSTLDQLADTGLWVSAAQQDIASPAIESFRKLCRTVREDFSSKVVREQDVAEQNKSVCAAEIARYRTDVEHELNRIIQLLPPGYEGVLEAREEAALLLSAIATDYTWADDYITSEKLREEALKLAENTLGAIRIQDGLEQIRASARHQRVSDAIGGFQKLCRDLREDSLSKVIREQDKAKQNKRVCAAEIARYRTEIEPELKRILQLLPPGNEGEQEAREEAALLLSAIATDYTWADDFITSEKLREEALKLAENTLGAIRIEDGLEHIRASARRQRIFGTPISSAPALSTFNSIGCTLYGHSDYDEETQSYATTHYLVALFLPILPLGRYRVINAGGNSYRFLGKLPLRKADRWHLGIVLSGVAAMILFGMINSNQSQTYTPPATTSSSYTSSSGQNADSSSSSGETSSGVSSNNAQLSDLSKRIDAERAVKDPLEARLNPVRDEFNNLTDRIKPLEAQIKALDQQRAEGVEIDRERRNSLFDEYDRLFKRRNALIDANRSDIDTLKDLEKQDETMMKQWKALGGKVN